MNKVVVAAGMEVIHGLNNTDLPLPRLILPMLLLRANLPIAETNTETPNLRWSVFFTW